MRKKKIVNNPKLLMAKSKAHCVGIIVKMDAAPMGISANLHMELLNSNAT
jgi:hypothetical protein